MEVDAAGVAAATLAAGLAATASDGAPVAVVEGLGADCHPLQVGWLVAWALDCCPKRAAFSGRVPPQALQKRAEALTLAPQLIQNLATSLLLLPVNSPSPVCQLATNNCYYGWACVTAKAQANYLRSTLRSRFCPKPQQNTFGALPFYPT